MEQAREKYFLHVQSETLTGLRGYRLLIWSNETFLVAASHRTGQPVEMRTQLDENKWKKKRSHFCKSKWTVTDEALRLWIPWPQDIAKKQTWFIPERFCDQVWWKITSAGKKLCVFVALINLSGIIPLILFKKKSNRKHGITTEIMWFSGGEQRRAEAPQHKADALWNCS